MHLLMGESKKNGNDTNEKPPRAATVYPRMFSRVPAIAGRGGFESTNLAALIFEYCFVPVKTQFTREDILFMRPSW